MTTYDEEILKEYAGKLYNKAHALILVYIFLGICAGAALGLLMQSNNIFSDNGFIFGFALLFGVAGYFIGESKAFELKFRAQLALCLAQIEENTR